jgi:EpsI family protein
MVKKNFGYILSVGILIVSILAIYGLSFSSREEGVSLNKIFPSRILDWTSQDVQVEPFVMAALSPDLAVSKVYTKRGKPSITLFMAYYTTMEKADLSHSPIVCFTGQGWEFLSVTTRKVPVTSSGRQVVSVNHSIQKKLDTTLVTLYWYQSVNEAYANRGYQKLALFFGKLMGAKDNNAFMRLTAAVPPGGSVDETSAMLFAFFQDAYPEFRRFFE